MNLVHSVHLCVVCGCYNSHCFPKHHQLIILSNGSLLRSVRNDSLRKMKIDFSFQRVVVFFRVKVTRHFQAVVYCTARFNNKKLRISMCFVPCLQYTAFISLKGMNWILFVMETDCVFCEVRTHSVLLYNLASGFTLKYLFPRPSSHSTYCPRLTRTTVIWQRGYDPHYLRTTIAEKTYTSCQKRKTANTMFVVCWVRNKPKFKNMHSCSQIEHDKNNILTGKHKTQPHFSTMFFYWNTSFAGHKVLSPTVHYTTTAKVKAFHASRQQCVLVFSVRF